MSANTKPYEDKMESTLRHLEKPVKKAPDDIVDTGPVPDTADQEDQKHIEPAAPGAPAAAA